VIRILICLAFCLLGAALGGLSGFSIAVLFQPEGSPAVVLGGAVVGMVGGWVAGRLFHWALGLAFRVALGAILGFGLGMLVCLLWPAAPSLLSSLFALGGAVWALLRRSHPPQSNSDLDRSKSGSRREF